MCFESWLQQLYSFQLCSLFCVFEWNYIEKYISSLHFFHKEWFNNLFVPTFLNVKVFKSICLHNIKYFAYCFVAVPASKPNIEQEPIIICVNSGYCNCPITSSVACRRSRVKTSIYIAPTYKVFFVMS